MDDIGGADGVEAVHQCDANLDFGGLAVWVSRGDAVAKGVEAAHLGLDPTSGIVSSLRCRGPRGCTQDGAQPSCHARGLVAGPASQSPQVRQKIV